MSGAPIDIAGLLPHAGDMVLIDRIVAWDAAAIVCGATTHRRPDNPLRHSGHLSALAGVEYAGQAIAIHAALLAERPLKSGVLASLRNLEWRQEDLAAVGGELIVRARRQVAGRGGARYEFDLGDGDAAIITGSATDALFE